MSLYFNSQMNNREIYHQADLDKASLNMAQRQRDDNNPMRLTGKGTGVNPVPVYKYESVAFPELQQLKRMSDTRHQVLENRRHDRFNHSHHPFYLDAPLN